MNAFLNRIGWVFAGLFGLAVAGLVAVQMIWINPPKACEASGNWWDPESRSCGRVIYLPDVTRRPIGSKALPTYPGLPTNRDQAAGANSAPLPASRP